VLLLFEACFGLEIDGLEGRVLLRHPQVPSELSEIRIHELEVLGSRLDLSISRDGDGVAVRVLRREGNVEVLVVP
jgi:hypothetical protein